MLDELLEDLRRAREEGAPWYVDVLNVSRETRERLSRSVLHIEGPLPLQVEERDAPSSREIALARAEPEPKGLEELPRDRTPRVHDPHENVARAGNTLPLQATLPKRATIELAEGATCSTDSRAVAS